MTALALPALVIGPESGGRGFRVLAQSETVPLDAAAQARLAEVPLALAEWAGHDEPGFIACLPLSAQYSLMLRGKNFGMGSGGYLAFANALLIPATPQTAALKGYELLPLLSEPDGTPAFAQKPALFDPARPVAAPMVRNWSGLGLEWARRALFVPQNQDVEQVTASVLAASERPVEAWATTLYLRTENLRPAEIFTLFVLPDTQKIPQNWPHRIAVATATGFQGDAATPPETWQAWQAIQSLSRAAPAWRAALQSAVLQPPNFLDDQAAVKQLKGIVFRTVAQLDAKTVLEYMSTFLLGAEQSRNMVLTAIGEELVAFVFSKASQDDIAYYLNHFARLDLLHLKGIRAAYQAPGVLPHIAQTEFRRLLPAGFADDLLANPDREARLQEMTPGQFADLAAYFAAREGLGSEDADYFTFNLLLVQAARDRGRVGSLDLIRDAVQKYLRHAHGNGAARTLLRFVQLGNQYKAAVL
ncbi:MAG TPA: hypothetical protein VG839_10230 [Asticcacaulis sp.]|nr:hypothetical protein [Asticcacaulis sp.]